MKRSMLLAAMVGVLLLGGGIYGLTRPTASSSAGPKPPANHPSAAGETSTEQPTSRPATSSSPTTSAATSTTTPTAAIDPDKGGAQQTPVISPEAADRAAARGVDPAAAIAASKRPGETQLRPTPAPSPGPVSSEEAAVARQKHLKQQLTKAACTAPDIGERLAQMPADDGRKLVERCAAAGITITAAKR